MTQENQLSKQALLWQLTLATLPENQTDNMMWEFMRHKADFKDKTSLDIMHKLTIALKGKTAKWINDTLIDGFTKKSISKLKEEHFDDKKFVLVDIDLDNFPDSIRYQYSNSITTENITIGVTTLSNDTIFASIVSIKYHN